MHAPRVRPADPSPALFLDRDGTVIVERHYLNDPKLVQLEDGVIEGLQAAIRAGYRLIIVTNQSGIARGNIRLVDYLAVHRRMLDMLAQHGISITATYYCPHHPTEGSYRFKKSCDCRKPAPGMINQGMRDHAIDASRSVMIGDRLSDCKAGAAAGIRSIHILTGHGATEPSDHPFETAPSLSDAIFRLLR